MKKNIVTHVNPDLDALASVYLLKRYLFDDEANNYSIILIPAGQAAPTDAAAVSDCGGVYDEAAHRFDHHQFPGMQASSTSATEMVYNYLSRHNWPHLEALVNIVTDGDGRDFRGKAAQWSFAHGLHAVLSAWKAQRLPDADLVKNGLLLLERYDKIARHYWYDTYQEHIADLFTAYPEYAQLATSTAQVIAKAGDEYEACKVWQSGDGKVVALVNGSAMATNYALGAGGCDLVVWATEIKDSSGAVLGWARGAQANTERCHAGNLVTRTIRELRAFEAKLVDFSGYDVAIDAIIAELLRWFLHPAGFMAGVTAKGDPTLLKLFGLRDTPNVAKDVAALANVLRSVMEL